MKIISRFDDNVLFDGNHDSIRLCVEDAASAKIALCCADLRNANLHGANLHGADLRDANLSDANLHGAYLRNADLLVAYLRNADLRNANLRNANLCDANLHGADLRNANLRNADLHGANLHGANLSGANLHGANLSGADLRNADLRNADLRDAYLCDADLRDAYLSNWKIVPPAGSFVAWKKGGNGEIIKIKIPAWARRTSCLINRKCRAEFVVTLEITKEGKSVLECCGGYDKNTTYRVGKCTAPDKYDPDERVDCSHGIHFFLTREEAEEW
jgi:uncharacterized protein YjbI with pentapeptide repeats